MALLSDILGLNITLYAKLFLFLINGYYPRLSRNHMRAEEAGKICAQKRIHRNPPVCFKFQFFAHPRLVIKQVAASQQLNTSLLSGMVILNKEIN